MGSGIGDTPKPERTQAAQSGAGAPGPLISADGLCLPSCLQATHTRASPTGADARPKRMRGMLTLDPTGTLDLDGRPEHVLYRGFTGQ